ncbi:MAG: phosphate ABC transporter substrate-binding protein PstS [Ilumatobacteraceae bacterium]
MEFDSVNSFSLRRTALAVALAGTLVLAACGDDDDDDTSSTEAAGAASTEPAAATTTGGSDTSTSGGTDSTSASDTTEGGGDVTVAPMEPVSGTLIGAGASSQTAAMQAWQAGFQEANPDATVEYDPVGSGGGREAFLAEGSNTDFAGSDAYLSDEEVEASTTRCAGDQGAIDLPHYVSPIVVAFNLPDIESLNLAPEVMAGIFAGTITTWDDDAIAADNPDVELPGTTINAVHRSDESGTTQNFTQYLAAVAPDVWTYEPDQEWPLENGEGAQGTSGVVAAIQAGEGSVGYADASQVSGLGAGVPKVGDEWVPFSPEAAAKLVDVSTKVEGRNEYDLSFDLVRDTTESGVYPIALVSYHIVCLQYDSQEQADLVKAFMAYVGSSQGQADAAANAGSAPLSDDVLAQVETAVAQISAG